MRNVPPNLYSIRGLMGCCLFLHDGDNSVMVDSGLVGETIQLRRLFRRLGLAPQALKAVLLTHGHLDHAAMRPASKTGAAPEYTRTRRNRRISTGGIRTRA